MHLAVIFRSTDPVDAGTVEGYGVERSENAQIAHLRLLGRRHAIAVHRKIIRHADIKNPVAAVIRDRLGSLGHRFQKIVLRRKVFPYLGPAAFFVLPAEWIHALPADEAMPMEIFLIAPPNPPIGCPLKWDRTTVKS